MAPTGKSSAAGATPRARRPARLAALAVLFLLPLSLRLAPIRHGLPCTAYVPDTHIVRGALGMAQSHDLVPPSGVYTTYPYLLPYLLLPLYGVEYAAGRAAGAWSSAAQFGARLLEQPALAHLPARLLVALLGALTPWAVFRASRAMGLGVGAWVAAWLVGTGTLHVHFSVQERPWVPLALWLALSAAFAAEHVARGGARALALSALAAGLAFATHQGGLPALGIPALAWLLAPAGWAGPALARRARRAGAGLLLFAAVSLLLGHPYLLVHGQTAAEQVSGGLPGGEIAVGGQAFAYRFRGASLARMAQAFALYDPALVLLALPGLWWALRRRAALPATLFALGWGAIFLTNFNDHVRYLLPLAVLLAPAAGFAAERLWSARAGRAALVLLLLLPLVQSVRLGFVLVRPDTRAEAAQRLAAAGGRVALDVYGPDVPLDRASLERLSAWRPLYSREAHRLELLRAGAPTRDGPGLDAVRLEDLFDYDARTHGSALKPGAAGLVGDPSAILRGLGVTHVLLVDRDPGDGVEPFPVDPTPPEGGAPKLAPLEVDPQPLWVIDPAGSGGPAREARLPTELTCALLSLWQVERPGPRLSLHRLAEAR
jgi:hypothetical protein